MDQNIEKGAGQKMDFSKFFKESKQKIILVVNRRDRQANRETHVAMLALLKLSKAVQNEGCIAKNSIHFPDFRARS